MNSLVNYSVENENLDFANKIPNKINSKSIPRIENEYVDIAKIRNNIYSNTLKSRYNAFSESSLFNRIESRMNCKKIKKFKIFKSLHAISYVFR